MGVNKPRNRRRDLFKPACIVAALAVVATAAHLTDLTEYVSLDGLGRLRAWILGFGPVAPVVFIVLYAFATVLFLPGTPLSLLAGLVFGPVFGTLWVVIGATIGATLAFLIGRYAARGLVEGWTVQNERIKRLDEGVEKQGWRMLLITRLVPVFPFNLQNYAYGITKIGPGTYVLLTAVCIIPGAAVFTFAGGSLASAQQNLTRTFIYLGVAAVFFVAVSLIPGWVQRRNRGKQ
ncbi:TVP38/TMEM64 family protein [Rubrobacter tropicus]|uniref:TVP38/TMEM64 family membrane protein n=1 Tax=Rubrobacter tropicus TaxID=2653851 RepID=A0A6G8QB85_9ACTN|nr:TVP38/TMEM64 family protein [Rubrobacter tropicus]QIN83567.1 TVP38/TMEM64 family protein [Rubrobacter tropicus]